MKTKKLLMLLVAMLLSSVSAFAQSNGPLSGDVNGDNKVDVADIVAIISALAQSTEPQNGDVNGDNKVDANDIMAIITIMKNGGGTSETTYYWYVGQTRPTSLDGLSPINEYTSPIEYTNTSGTRGYVYILLHNSKSITSVIDKVSNGNATFRIIDDNTIPDYNIWRTAALVNNGTWIITIE